MVLYIPVEWINLHTSVVSAVWESIYLDVTCLSTVRTKTMSVPVPKASIRLQITLQLHFVYLTADKFPHSLRTVRFNKLLK